MRRLLPAGLLLLMGNLSFGQAIWTGPSGGGMLGVQEPIVAESGHGAIGIVLDNYDRDPRGLDIDEVRQSLRIGLGRRWELYGSYYFSRAVTIPGGQHPAPASPTDIMVLSGPKPAPPYRTIYWPLPYTGRNSSSLGDAIPGDITVGLKHQFRRQQKALPAVSLSANVIMPGSNSINHQRRGSDSTSIDVALHAATCWTYGRWTFAANLGYIRSGPLSAFNDDHIITPDGAVTVVRLHRPDFVRMAGGARFTKGAHTALIAELYHSGPIGTRTPSLESAGATDAILGLQIDAWRFTIIAGIRQHLFAPPDHAQRVTGPLTGAVDLSQVVPAQRDAWLAAHGMPPTAHREEATLVVMGIPEDTPLPAGAQTIPGAYVTRTEGNIGGIFAVSFRF